MSFFVVSCGCGGGFWLFSCNAGYSFSVSFDASFFSSWPLFFGMSQSHLWAFSLSQLTPMVISSSYMAWNDIYEFVITKCMSFLISDLSYEPHIIYTWISSGHLKFNLAKMKLFISYPIRSSFSLLSLVKGITIHSFIQFLNKSYSSTFKIYPEFLHLSTPLLLVP